MVTLALVGAGLRGQTYARHATASGRGHVVAVAEPDRRRRENAAAEFGIPAERVFADWVELAAAGRVADAAIVATQDRLHRAPAVRLAGLGYHVLLEKPMAPTEGEAAEIAAAALHNGVIVAVCHVLRYTPYTRLIKRLLDEGRVGRLISVEHLEPVGWWHQAHSFVRGNWNREDVSGPMLLTKSCHDIDWLVYLFGRLPARVASFGSLTHFRVADRPEGAADRCLDCRVEPRCPYSAKRLYLRALADPAQQFWPLGAVVAEPTEPAVLHALRTGPYGRCVYACDNDVVDHQVVIMEFADGATCSFTMTAFSPFELRKTRLFGTHGYLEGDGSQLRLLDFRTGEEELIHTGGTNLEADHTDADETLTDTFLAAVAANDPALLSSDATTSLASHQVVWAAERSRHSGTVVALP
jgi:predicted dehydrogenase